MRAGKLKRFITLSRITNVRNKFGENEKEMIHVLTARAEVLSVKSSEVDSTQIAETHSLEFRIRYTKILEPLDTDFIIEYRGANYEVISAKNLRELNKQVNFIAKRF